MRKFCIADIHGNFKALKQCLELSKFSYKKDSLIVLGDVCDGFPFVKDCIEELLKIKNLIFILGNHDCFSKDTEYLTENGWQKFDEISNNLKLAQFDIITKEITFASPLKRISKFAQYLYRIEGNNTCQIVTPNHEIIYQNKKIKAKDLDDNFYEKYMIDFGNVKHAQTYFSDLNLLKLLIWVINDGTIVYTTKGLHRIQFHLSKDRKINKLKSLLTTLNLKYTFRKGQLGGYQKLQSYYITLYGPEARYIESFIPNKKLPSYFRNLNEIECKTILEAILDTDGSLSNTKNRISMVTIDKEKANILQELFIKNQYPCTIRYNEYGSGFKNGKPQYQLNIQLQKTHCTYFRGKKEKIIYNDLAHCFTMPKGTLITRYNGKVAFTGNCWALGWYQLEASIRIEKRPSWFDYWYYQGGKQTAESYGGLFAELPTEHLNFLKRARLYYVDENNNLYVHGGIEPNKSMINQDKDLLLWDRDLLRIARHKHNQKPNYKYATFNKIFIGHTTTEIYGTHEPLTACNVIALDTGAGWSGKLTIMDINSGEFWQSDLTRELYPDIKGR